MFTQNAKGTSSTQNALQGKQKNGGRAEEDQHSQNMTQKY